MPGVAPWGLKQPVCQTKRRLSGFQSSAGRILGHSVDCTKRMETVQDFFCFVLKTSSYERITVSLNHFRENLHTEKCMPECAGFFTTRRLC